jgi:hypothetical protein
LHNAISSGAGILHVSAFRARGIRRSTMSILPRLLFRGRHCCQYVLPWTSGCDLGSQGGRH